MDSFSIAHLNCDLTPTSFNPAMYPTHLICNDKSFVAPSKTRKLKFFQVLCYVVLSYVLYNTILCFVAGCLKH